MAQSVSRHKDIRGYTFEEDVVLGIGGVHNIWQGVGENGYCWAKRRLRVLLARHMQYVRSHAGRVWYQRIGSISVKDVKAKVRRMAWFENEGIMKKYGPDGSDYYRYARVM